MIERLSAMRGSASRRLVAGRSRTSGRRLISVSKAPRHLALTKGRACSAAEKVETITTCGGSSVPTHDRHSAAVAAVTAAALKLCSD